VAGSSVVHGRVGVAWVCGESVGAGGFVLRDSEAACPEELVW